MLPKGPEALGDDIRCRLESSLLFCPASHVGKIMRPFRTGCVPTGVNTTFRLGCVARAGMCSAPPPHVEESRGCAGSRGKGVCTQMECACRGPQFSSLPGCPHNGGPCNH